MIRNYQAIGKDIWWVSELIGLLYFTDINGFRILLRSSHVVEQGDFGYPSDNFLDMKKKRRKR